jgi:hypothetical protein
MVADALRDRRARLRVRFHQQHDELIAAESRSDVGAANRARDRARDGAEHLGAGLVAERLVDLREIVDVDHR